MTSSADSVDDFPTSPGAVKIISLSEENDSFVLNEKHLEKILLDPRCVGKKVALVSIVGAFRTGKSFLLNFFHHYLSSSQKNEWLSALKTLNGFKWRRGPEPETSGIFLWSEPYVIKDANNEDIVVLLMDTQGIFDSNSTGKQNTTIFALSTLLSSLQIYNLKSNLQEDNLQNLQFFTEYGKFALDECSETPFQSLIFLVRDWDLDDKYGFAGGNALLKDRLEIKSNQKPELRKLREQIYDLFENIRCFLMPAPGKKVTQGKFSDLDSEFEEQLNVFVPHLLNSNNLKAKLVNGQPVTCSQLFEYFKTYVNVFQSKDLPEVESIYNAGVKVQMLEACSKAKALYNDEMGEICCNDAPYLSPIDFEMKHSECKKFAILEFDNATKIYEEEIKTVYKNDLIQDIDSERDLFRKLNDANKRYNDYKTVVATTAAVATILLAKKMF